MFHILRNQCWEYMDFMGPDSVLWMFSINMSIHLSVSGPFSVTGSELQSNIFLNCTRSGGGGYVILWCFLELDWNVNLSFGFMGRDELYVCIPWVPQTPPPSSAPSTSWTHCLEIFVNFITSLRLHLTDHNFSSHKLITVLNLTYTAVFKHFHWSY